LGHALELEFHGADGTLREPRGKVVAKVGGEPGSFGSHFVDRAFYGDDVGIPQRERVEKEMEECVADDVGGDVFAAAEDDGVVVRRNCGRW